MDNGNREVLIAVIVNQVQDLYLAELVRVADCIQGLKAARKYMAIDKN